MTVETAPSSKHPLPAVSLARKVRLSADASVRVSARSQRSREKVPVLAEVASS